jgi:hypothetical protein
MLELAIAFVAGLVVGWNFLAQPVWVKDLLKKYLP